MNNNTYVAIMAGGIGSRFWPASRTARPKQFMDILGVGKSLIRLTFERFLKLCPPENIFIVTNGMYKDLVKQHLPELTDNQILCEPSRNNTAPCVAYTAFKLQALEPGANFVVAPSDHIILKEGAFIELLQKALAFTNEHDAFCTLGITPTRPDTGYGYIHYQAESQAGVHKVRAFKEKPELDQAMEYLASGEYLWNAGIFIWKAKHVLNAYKTLAPEIHEILSAGAADYNTPREQGFIDQQYPLTPSISVDYAILEKATNVYTIPADIGWSDLGTWGSLHAETEQDASSNVVQGEQVVTIEVNNSLIRIPNGKLAVIKGLDNYIIVDEGDVLLIYPKDQEQEIKTVNTKISESFGERYS